MRARRDATDDLHAIIKGIADRREAMPAPPPAFRFRVLVELEQARVRALEVVGIRRGRPPAP